MTILQIEVYAKSLKIYIDKYKEVEGEKLSIIVDQLGNGDKKHKIFLSGLNAMSIFMLLAC
jgi:hypothetical protein